MVTKTFKFNDFKLESITIDENGKIIASVPEFKGITDWIVMSPYVWEVGDYLQIDVGKEYIELPVPVVAID